MLRQNIDRFDATAEDLLKIVREKQPELVDDVDYYIVGCRHNQTANLLWRFVDKTSCLGTQVSITVICSNIHRHSLVTTRYGLGDTPRDADGGMTISLE